MSAPPLVRRTSSRLSSRVSISLSEHALIRSYSAKALIETSDKSEKLTRKRSVPIQDDDDDDDADSVGDASSSDEEVIKKKTNKKPKMRRTPSKAQTMNEDEDEKDGEPVKAKKQRVVRMTSKIQVEEQDQDGNIKLVRQSSSLKRVIVDLPKRSADDIAKTLAAFNTKPVRNEPYPIGKDRRKGKYLGAHVSMAGTMGNAARNAALIGARCFACDTKSKRQWASIPYTRDSIEDFKQACAEYGFTPDDILPHGSYLMNCGSPVPENLEKSRACLLDECQRCEQLGIRYYNFHPGNTNGEITVEKCLTTIAESLNWVHQKTSFVVTVIENMAGQGNHVGGSFQHLKSIIDQVDDKSRVGVCLDTCHAFAAGYDISTHEGILKTLKEFDEIVGLRYLCGIHLNDSKRECGSRRDLHENIGKGHIGMETFRSLMNDPRLDGIPMILETPVDDTEGKDHWKTVYGREIKLLYDLVKK